MRARASRARTWLVEGSELRHGGTRSTKLVVGGCALTIRDCELLGYLPQPCGAVERSTDLSWAEFRSREESVSGQTDETPNLGSLQAITGAMSGKPMSPKPGQGTIYGFLTPPPTPPLVADVVGLEGDETGSITPMLGPIPEMAPINTPMPPHLGRPAGDVPEMKPKEPGACDTLVELLPPSVVLGFISAMCAALYTTGTKVATDQRLSPGSHISVPFLLLLRGIIGLPLVLYEAYGLEGQSFPPGNPEQLPLMITSGVMAMLGTALGLYATSMWGNASVACIVNTSPALTVIITAIICIPDLHEALNLRSCIMLVIALTGMVFVTRPEFIWGESKDASDVGYIPPLAALGQASLQSVTALMIRKIPGKPSAASITFYVQISMLFFGLVLSCYDVYGEGEKISVNWDSPAGPITGMLLFAVCGTGANYFKNKALRLSKSVLVVGLRFFTPIICYVGDLCIMSANPNYHIHSDTYSYIGCALIILAGVMLLLLKRQREASGVSTVSDGGTTPPVQGSPVATPEDESNDNEGEIQPLLSTTEKASS